MIDPRAGTSMESPDTRPLTNAQRRARERPVWRWGLGISLLIHGAVLFYLPVRSTLVPPEAAAGPAAGDDRAAAGGLQAVTLRTPPSRPVIPPPIPVPTLAEMQPLEFEPETALEPAAVQGDIPGLDPGPGLDDGTGQGDGGEAEAGEFRAEPPVPRAVMFPSAPDDDGIRGEEVEVWVFVDERGRVVPDSTRLRPATSNGDYNRRLVRDAAEWAFEPATRDGEAVSSWFNYRFTLGG